MIKIFYKGIKHKRLQELKKLRGGVWVHAENPTDKEIESLVFMLDVEENLLRDALDPFEVPRLEEENGFVYVFTQVPYREGDAGATTRPVLFVLGKTFVLTVSSGKTEIFNQFVSERRKIYTTQQTKMFIRFLFALNGEYTRHLARMGKEIRSVSKDVEQVGVDDLTRFVAFEKTANDFLAALVPMRANLHTLLSEQYLTFYEEDKELIEDLFLSIGQLVETSRATHRHIVDIREASSVIMTHTLNRSIKTLTIFTIVLSIPTILGALYGMNVPLPLAEQAWIFWIIISISLMGMGALFTLLARNK